MSIPELSNEMEPGFDFGQAFAEANRCLLCYDPPCSKGCPGETDPGAFIRKFRFHNIKGAIRTIKTNNVMGGACGVLCPTAELCELECAASGIGKPIQIGKIQRFLIEHSWQIGFNPLERAEETKAKVAIVGSGPGGLSCAAELAKLGFRPTIFEARAKPGGVLAFGVPAYRMSPDFVAKEVADVTALGVEIVCSHPIDGEGAVEKLFDDGFKAVFLAPGCWEAVRLNDDQEDIPGLFTSVEFLSAFREERFDDMAPHVKDKVVAVMGGGSVAMDCVGQALRHGAKDVYLVYRRSYTQMPAEEEERIESLESGTHFILLNQPLDYIANDAGDLCGLKLVRTRLGDVDASGRRSPVNVEGSEWVLDVDTAVEAFGNRPPADSPTWYPSVEVNKWNLIVADTDDTKTSVDGIFAGGDIVRGPALVVKAVQDGKVAARAISEYLSGQED